MQLAGTMAMVPCVLAMHMAYAWRAPLELHMHGDPPAADAAAYHHGTDPQQCLPDGGRSEFHFNQVECFRILVMARCPHSIFDSIMITITRTMFTTLRLAHTANVVLATCALHAIMHV